MPKDKNARTYNLAQNPSVHMEIEHLLSVAGEFCFTVTCNGQNFVQKYTPTGVTLIPVKQDRPYARKVRPLSVCCKMVIHHHLTNVNCRLKSVCLCTRITAATNVAEDVVEQHVVERLRGSIFKKLIKLSRYVWEYCIIMCLFSLAGAIVNNWFTSLERVM